MSGLTINFETNYCWHWICVRYESGHQDEVSFNLENAMFPIRRILHPTDFSEQSSAAFEVACALARDYSAELTVLHVCSTPPVYFPDGIAVPLPGEDPYRTRVQLYEIQPNDPRVKVQHVLVEGNPIDQILKQARSDSADLIVMGTHGSSGLTRLLMGSVAESVTRKAACPVLTLRKPFHPTPEDLIPDIHPAIAAG
jgi:nucleotide-binding universal stress UspA family protein